MAKRYDAAMAQNNGRSRRSTQLWRALIEMTSIMFLFYSNLLMGEFTASSGHGKTLLFALQDIFTVANFLIALLSSMIGYLAFEFLRRKI